jgi:hypothetical protein
MNTKRRLNQGVVNNTDLTAKKLSMSGFVFIALVLALTAATLPVLAQTAGTGALAGTVSDPSGAVVLGAQVSVTNEATGVKRQVTTQGNGSYFVPLLLPGSYKVEVSMTGFKLATVRGIRVDVTETARLDLKLEVGSTQEQVGVTADAQMLQTDSSTLGRVVGPELVTDLPLVTRNYTDIVTLSPGIAVNVRDATNLGSGSGSEDQGNFRVNGSFGRDNNFQMNGVPINDLFSREDFTGGIPIPNPDTIGEFKVQTGTTDASYGSTAGANVNVVTKGGSNAFHGTVFEFFRNDVLNANGFFQNQTGQKRGVLKQNQFGFTLGGPIVKDKLLFFISYQGTRQINGIGSGSTSNIFTPPLTNDRSRAALGQLFVGQRGVYQILFGDVGPAIAADGSNISPQAFALLNMKLPDGQYLIPAPQTIDTSNPFALQGFSAFSIPGRFNEDQLMLNLDYVISGKSTISIRSFGANGAKTDPLPGLNPGVAGPNVPGFPWSSNQHFRNVSLTHTYLFNPSLVNLAAFGFSRTAVAADQGELFKWSDIGSTVPPAEDAYPIIDIAGSLQTGGNGQGANIPQNHYTYQDSVTYSRGRHTLQFGGSITHNQIDLEKFHYYSGAVFLSWPDFLLGLPAGPAPPGNGTPLSNIIESIDVPGDHVRHWRVTDANAYVQDSIQLFPTFTLNLGARFDRLQDFSDELGRNTGFNIAAANPNPPAGGTLAGYVVSQNFQGEVPAGVAKLDNSYGILGDHQNNFGPRIGFAWQLPHAGHRVALRGGYGIYYSRAPGQDYLQGAGGPPFGEVRIISAFANAGATFANPLPPVPSFPNFIPYSPTTQITALFVDPHFRPPVTQQYSLNVQTVLGHNFLLEVGYIGTRGTHGLVRRNLNQALLASDSNPIRGETTNTIANIPLRVPIQGFAANEGLDDTTSTAASWYNGLETSVTKRMSHGLQFLAAYTFSRCLSTAGANTGAAGDGVLPGDQRNPKATYGRCDFNREHRFVFSYVYELPKPTRFNSFINNVLGGWALSGVTTIQSGQWLTLTGTNANNVFGDALDLAQIIPGCKLATSGSTKDRLDSYLNAACVMRNAAGAAIWPVVGDDGVATAFGNSGVGIVKGTGQNNFDLSIVKQTPIRKLGEGANVEFRAEFFNAFNHPQFSNPDTNVSDTTFGVISSTAVNPRIAQLALKLNF